jgi:DNA helicase-2/ATP-dependent DNA helicase PcrA
LTRNYRSTPQVLDVANRLTKGPRDLTATRPDGPGVALASYADGRDETEAIVAEIDKLAADGTPFEEIAILYRINARSDDYEEALAAARIPYQVRDGAFLRRPGPRAVLRRVQRADGPAAQLVEKAARDLGWDPDSGDEPDGTEEATRLADLARLVKLAEEHGGSLREFLADLRKRFEDDGAARGVVLSTYHRAKGLEWDAVFLPRLEEREIPFAMSKSDDEVAEERRLLYVGITRARSYLRLSYARTRDGKNVRPSRFLAELRNEPPAKKEDPDLFAKLRAWRKTTADAGGVPPYVVFHDSTLREICEHHPGSLDDLARVSGVGPAKLERYGRQILDVLRQG